MLAAPILSRDPQEAYFSSLLGGVGDEHEALEERSAVTRSATYLIAFGYFEHRTGILLRRHQVALKPRANVTGMLEASEVQRALRELTDDYEDLQRHLTVLRILRNELAHGGGAHRAPFPPVSTSLVREGHLEVIEDSPGYALIKLSENFIQATLTDLYAAFRAISVALRQLSAPPTPEP